MKRQLHKLGQYVRGPLGDPAWRRQQELLAHGANPGAAVGTVKRMAESARLGQREGPVVQGPGIREL
jgi:hypothetical protein